MEERIDPLRGPCEPGIYRLYDGSGNLLYVGVSGMVGPRIRRHLLWPTSRKPWAHLVTAATIESCGGKDFRREEAVIAAERPRYNGTSGLDRCLREFGVRR